MIGSFDQSVCLWDMQDSLKSKSSNAMFKLLKKIELPSTPLSIKVIKVIHMS